MGPGTAEPHGLDATKVDSGPLDVLMERLRAVTARFEGASINAINAADRYVGSEPREESPAENPLDVSVLQEQMEAMIVRLERASQDLKLGHAPTTDLWAAPMDGDRSEVRILLTLVVGVMMCVGVGAAVGARLGGLPGALFGGLLGLFAFIGLAGFLAF